ncbi:RNA polymerase sigma factor [Novosphingobium resinovorum]|uniref:RNA polymerase sigma factor n=1 Tax=Novosphingobium TaxID=165696 RepID=UPI001B3C8C7B|nr:MULTISPECIES: RNA polymerase sigma factor [Novosphingobium]MBF7013717.1 RNA polymerase sigma factor [Novosphingobium sp. HR1a]WJM25859.1 RNA polymerase sigma factor [Novosphingobium resinovorum]
MANDSHPDGDTLDRLGHHAVNHSTDGAFSRLYREESRWLVRYFHRNSVSSAEAEELAQETFLRFFRSGAAMILKTPQAYLRRIAINLLRDHSDLSSTRVERLKSPLSDAAELSAPIDPMRILAARADIAFCEKVLDGLDPLDRELFLLSRVEGYSFREIGRQKGLNEWAVKRKVFRTLDHLVDIMERR